MPEILRRDPLRMDVLSNGPIGYWMGGLIDYARENGHSIIIENTLSNVDFIAGEIEKFHAAGFRVRLAAMAVAAPVSRLGVVERYREAQRFDSAPRFTSEASHSAGYKALVPGITQLEPLVDEVTVFTRDRRELPTGIGIIGPAIECERAEWFADAARREEFLARFAELDLTGLEDEPLTQNLLKDVDAIRAW